MDIISLNKTCGVCFVNRYTYSSEQVGKWKVLRHETTSHNKQ